MLKKYASVQGQRVCRTSKREIVEVISVVNQKMTIELCFASPRASFNQAWFIANHPSSQATEYHRIDWPIRRHVL